MGKRKRLGFETDVWALVDSSEELHGGSIRAPVFWTKQMAKQEAAKLKDCKVVRVRIVEVEAA